MEQKNMLPGLTREAEEQKLQEIIGIAQQNLERARADIRKVNEDLEDLLDVYEAQDKEGLALWNNATARLKENEYDLVRYEKARRKPYFGRIDFKDPNVKGDERPLPRRFDRSAQRRRCNDRHLRHQRQRSARRGGDAFRRRHPRRGHQAQPAAAARPGDCP